MEMIKQIKLFVEIIISIGGSIVTVMGFLSWCSKNFRERLKKRLGIGKTEELIKDMRATVDSLVSITNKLKLSQQCSSRSRILSVYYKYIDKDSMPTYAKEALIKEYDNYKALGGNSFVENCFNELKNKPTKNK